MQAILGSLVAVSSFGVAYAAQLMFPVKPIQEADILLSQSTIGTVNILSKDELQSQQKTPRELITLYMNRKANLQDIIEIVSGKTGIRESYAQLKTMQQTPEIIFLIKSTERNYNITPEPESVKPSAPPVESSLETVKPSAPTSDPVNVPPSNPAPSAPSA